MCSLSASNATKSVVQDDRHVPQLRVVACQVDQLPRTQAAAARRLVIDDQELRPRLGDPVNRLTRRVHDLEPRGEDLVEERDELRTVVDHRDAREPAGIGSFFNFPRHDWRD